MNEWQPMKTAPKDGTKIAALYTNNLYYEPVIVWWDSDGGPYPWLARDTSYAEGRIVAWYPIPPVSADQRSDHDH